MLSDRCPVCLSVCPVTLLYCGQTVGWIKMKLGMQLLHRDPAAPKRDTAPQFSAQVCCGPTPGWIKMPLGTEVGLDPRDTVRWGSSSPLQKRCTCLLWPNGRPSQLLLSFSGPLILSTTVGTESGMIVKVWRMVTKMLRMIIAILNGI